MKLVTILLTVLLMPTLSHGEARRDAAVEALAQAGQRAGCRVPIGDLPGINRPWVIEREAGTAYVAWCARRAGGERVYDLVIATVSHRHPWASCPPHIRLGLHQPFPDLRVSVLPRDLPYPMKLSAFWYPPADDFLTGEGQPVDSTDIPKGPAIDFGAGGAGQLLLCRGDRWIMGGYH